VALGRLLWLLAEVIFWQIFVKKPYLNTGKKNPEKGKKK
jgi:hypothetical protein